MSWEERRYSFVYGLLCCKLLVADGQPKIFITYMDYISFYGSRYLQKKKMAILNEKSSVKYRCIIKNEYTGSRIGSAGFQNDSQRDLLWIAY